MATIIDALVVTLGLDSSGFQKGQIATKESLEKTKKEAEETATEMEAAGKRAVSFFSSIKSVLLGVTLSAADIQTFIINMSDSLQQLGINARALDISAKSLDGWQRSAEVAGSSAAKITSNLASFQDTLTKVRTGGGGDDPLFGALTSFAGATGTNFDYKNDTAEIIMRKIEARWNRLNEDGKRQFGGLFSFDNATQQALTNGNMVKDADQFTSSSTATEDVTEKAAEFNRKIVELKQSFAAAAQVLYSALIPYVEKLIPIIALVGDWISSHGPEINTFFSDSAAGVNHVIEMVGGWQNALVILLGFMAGKWALGMIAAISRVGVSAGGLGAKLASIGRGGVIGAVGFGAYEYADWIDKNSGPKKQLSENGQYYKDSWVGEAIGWWNKVSSTNGADNKYDGYGTAQEETYGDGYQRTTGPRGIRNNNPGNLHYTGQAGATIETGHDGGSPVFQGMISGSALLYRQIQRYFSRGINTISQIDQKYAPEAGGSDVFAYTKDLVKGTSKGANRKLNSGDMETIFRIFKSTAIHDNGQGYVTDDHIRSGIQVGYQATLRRNDFVPATGPGKTDIHISNMTVQSSAATADALGNDLARQVSRNRLVAASITGQG